MAGSYPDVPSRRMAWDDDGTVALYGLQNGADGLTELSAEQMVELNDEDNNAGVAFPGTNQPPRFYWVLFPELRELDGFYASSFGSDASGLGAVHTSPDTTNGRDGTWTQQIASAAQGGVVSATYRTSIISTAVSSIRGVRLAQASSSGGSTAGQRLAAEHLYGEISAGQTPDRLLFIDDATGLEFTLPIDYGNVPRGSSADRLIRLRNNSAAKTANTIQYTAQSLYLNSAAWYTATLPGGSTFQSTQQLASLAPATTSGLITLRRVTPNAETLGLHAARLYANVDTWT